MKILLLSATTFEIAQTTNSNTWVDMLIGGVGAPATIYQLTKKLNNSKYDLVIQAGIAGSFDHSFSLGQTVVVKADTFADVGVEEKSGLLNIFDMGLADKNEHPYQDGWLINENELLQKIDLPSVTAVTVNKITDSPLQNELVKKKYSATIESMEGAALHYVCLQEKNQFIQLRSISNYIGERDKTKWKMKDAISNLNIELQKLIASFQ
jgi:futalosine hydrolase